MYTNFKTVGSNKRRRRDYEKIINCVKKNTKAGNTLENKANDDQSLSNSIPGNSINERQNDAASSKIDEGVNETNPERINDCPSIWCYQRLPPKLFDIDIDTNFPPDEVNGLTLKKSVSEVSFLNDYSEPDVDLSDALADGNGNFVFSPDYSPEIVEIVQSGIREFQTKYLAKIEATFIVQVKRVGVMLRDRLEKAYATIDKQLNQEMVIIRSDHRNRIAEFEASTIYYQDCTNDLLEENAQEEDETDTKIQTIKCRTAETSAELKFDVETAVTAVRQALKEDHARQKLEYHERVMEATNIASNRRWVLEAKLKQDVKKRKDRIHALRLQNEDLEEKIDIAEIHAMWAFNRRENILFSKEREHHDSLVVKRSLERKLENQQKLNLDQIKTHDAQMAQMKELNQLREEHFNSELGYFKSLLAESQATFQEDIESCKESANLQDEAHEAAFESLSKTYDEELIALLESVQKIKKSIQSRPKLMQIGMSKTLQIMSQIQQLQAEISNGFVNQQGQGGSS